MVMLIVLTKTKVSVTTCHPKEERCVTRQRACLPEVGDPGLVGLVSFVFTL